LLLALVSQIEITATQCASKFDRERRERRALWVPTEIPKKPKINAANPTLCILQLIDVRAELKNLAPQKI